jgi:hypothetical protein
MSARLRDLIAVALGVAPAALGVGCGGKPTTVVCADDRQGCIGWQVQTDHLLCSAEWPVSLWEADSDSVLDDLSEPPLEDDTQILDLRLWMPSVSDAACESRVAVLQESARGWSHGLHLGLVSESDDGGPDGWVEVLVDGERVASGAHLTLEDRTASFGPHVGWLFGQQGLIYGQLMLKDAFVDEGGDGGRPFTISGTPHLAAPSPTAAWNSHETPSIRDLPPTLRAQLADHWAAAGRTEHASVASFARFSLQLMALGAPPELLTAAAAAAADEVRHARRCFGLAAAFGAPEAGVGALDVSGCLATAGDPAATLVELLREACIGETIAAAQAERACQLAVDPAVNDVLTEIVEDESRHAAYGWRCAKWLLEQHPELLQLAAAVLTRPPRPAAAPAPPPAHDPALARFGLLSPATLQAVAHETWEGVIRPARAVLLGRSESAPAALA